MFVYTEGMNEEFTKWIDRKIEASGLSRKQIIQKSSLEQSYGYKLLKGTRHTSERDYILDLCFAIRMNAEETQHTLRLYEMPLLSSWKGRDSLILYALDHHFSLDDANELLEENGYKFLKCSGF